jgi:hypothetical protein
MPNMHQAGVFTGTPARTQRLHNGAKRALEGRAELVDRGESGHLCADYSHRKAFDLIRQLALRVRSFTAERGRGLGAPC